MTTLNYDANGFIVGINRMKDGIDNVHDDTQEIIQILKSQNQIGNTRMRELTRAVKSANYRSESQASASISRTRSSSLDRRPRISSSASTDGTNNRNSNRSSSGSASRSTISRASSSAADRGSNSSGSSNRSTSSSNNSPDNARRERDANGRFVSDGSNSKRGFGLPGGGMGGFGSDVSGMDPMLDSIREAKELLSPIGRAGKLAGRAAKFSWSKFKSMKRREPLSNDETRHNRENEKLLDKIWKAIKKQGSGGSGGGLLGGLLGGGGRNRRGGRGRRGLLGRLGGLGGGLVRGLGRKLPYIGAAIGAGSLAMDWDGLNHKEKSAGVGGVAGGAGGALAGAAAGATIGSVVPVIGTAIGGIIGGGVGYWLGSGAGEALGAAASPYIEDWTNSITAYNLPKKMSDKWNDGIKPFFSRMDEMAGKMSAWIDQQMTDMGNGVSATGAGLAEALGLADLGSVAEKYESGGRGVGTVSTGAGDHGGVSYGTHQLSSKTGTMAAFLKSPDGQKFAGEFAGLSAGSAAFNTKYKDVANRRGDEFKKSQQDYITRTHYMPAKKIAEEYGFDTKNRGIQEAIYSHSTQYGANHKSRFKRVSESGVDMSDNEAVLKALYADKERYVDSDFKSSSANVRAGVRKRIKSEKADVLAIAKVSDVKNAVADTVTQKQPASKEADKSLAGKAKNNSSALGVSMGSMVPEKTKKANIANSSFSENKPMIFNSSTPAGSNTGYAPANMPASPVLKIPAAPKIKERLDSGGSNKPVILQSSNDTINQNLSDRGLAHAVTGGFGQDRMWG
ncbi:VgrG-related protein [Psychrobacter sp. AOP31-E1-50]|uniref:VgrG-related protein n=1 Tax=Psychrobacter sp. AOP31-E1-50 TaxID=3457692 RepID=UPI003FD9E41D